MKHVSLLTSIFMLHVNGMVSFVCHCHDLMFYLFVVAVEQSPRPGSQFEDFK